ncbi:MAG: hypothetical protein VW418_01735, partial [Gammaproteobacteria bacterium]
MHLKIISFIFINFLVISCGGGGGSSSENNNLITTSNKIDETCIAFGRNTSRCSFVHDGLERFYLIYKPQSLNQEDAPVLFALHGYGSSAAFHKSYT